MKYLLLILVVSCPVFAQFGDPQLENCRDDCDQELALRQDIAEAQFNNTVNGCIIGNVGTCVGCLFLTAPPAVIACWIACGLIVPTTCASLIDNAWSIYTNKLILAGNKWANCLERCELNCT